MGLVLLLVLLGVLLAGAVISGLLAVTIERVAYRPLRTAPRLIPLISAIGMSIFLSNRSGGAATEAAHPARGKSIINRS